MEYLSRTYQSDGSPKGIIFVDGRPVKELSGVYGLSEWADHQRGVRGRDDRARDENRLDSVWFGSANRFKQAAYRSALELAGAR